VLAGEVESPVLFEVAVADDCPQGENGLRAVQAPPGSSDRETVGYMRDGLIRAAQGHSVRVDLGLDPCQPPPVLYHGTVARFLDSIFADGLRPGTRTHVHLSASPETAATVGARRGRPVVLLIDSAAMNAGGHEFFRASNGVWLTKHVPPEFLNSEGCPLGLSRH
jgi:putative RNA 2'-phosphotransferase